MISQEEYLERREKFQKKIIDNNLDAYIVSSLTNIYYFTGVTYKHYQGRFLIIFTASGEPTFLVPKLEETHIKKKADINILSYGGNISEEMETYDAQLFNVLSNAKNVGIETSMLISTKLRLDKVFEKTPDFNLSPLRLVESLRLVKSSAEVEMIRNACLYAEKGMQLMLNKSYYGISVMEIYTSSKTLQIDAIKSQTYDPFDTEFLSAGWPAPLSAKPHSIPNLHNRFGKGPLAAMSIQRINGYFAELERTYFLSPPDEKIRQIFAVMRGAREVAFGMIRPGVRLNEVDKATNDYITEKGYGKYLLHTISHGIGLENHEDPGSKPGMDFVLEENMVLSIEPGIYIPEIGGVRHSDTVLVTKDGYELLTHFPMDLDSLTIKSPRILKRIIGKVVQKFVHMKADEPEP